MTNTHPAKQLKDRYLAGLASLYELIRDCEENGWKLERTGRGNLRIRGRDNRARWCVTIR